MILLYLQNAYSINRYIKKHTGLNLMANYKTLLLLAACLFTTACQQGVVAEYSAIPVPSDENRVKTALSSGQIVSSLKKKNSVLVYLQNSQINSDLSMTICVAITNHTKRPLPINAMDISAFGVSPDKEIYLPAYSKNGLILAEEQKYQAEAAFRILLGAINAASSSYSASYSHSYGRVNGSVDGHPIHGTYTSTTYNPAAGQLAADIENRKTSQHLQRLQGNMNASVYNLNATLFDSSVIQPNSTYAGLIVIKPSQKAKIDGLRIEVNFDDEKYQFDYKTIKNQ